MSHRTRYVTMAVIFLCGVTGLVLAHAGAWAAASLGWPNGQALGGAGPRPSEVLAFLLATALAVAVLRVPRSRTLAHEVVDELARASWPSRQETWRATWVVICTVVICALYLGLLDAAWLSLTDTLLTPSAGPLLAERAAP